MDNCFGHYAQKYFELGMNVIPIEDNKKPVRGLRWGHWQEHKQTQNEIDLLVHDHGAAKGIAIICGKTSGVVGFDFDYKYDELKMKGHITKEKWEQDCKRVEAIISSALPSMQPAKKAKVGWTVFFKWNEEMTKTIAADRNGVRLFDFKATGYIVMPPSFHSQTQGEAPVFYQWLNGSDEFGLENVEPIDQRVVIELAYQYGQSADARDTLMNSRHGRLFLKALSLCHVEANDERVVQRLFEIDREIHAHDPKGPYLADKKNVGYDAKKHTLSWVCRIRKFSGTPTNKSAVSVDSSGWDYFFEKSFYQLRKDKLTKDVFVKYQAGDNWEDIRKYKGYLKTEASRSKLKKDDVVDQLERYCATSRKLSLLCDLPKWDGVDRVSIMARSLKSDRLTHKQITEIVKRWGAGVFARADDSDFQNPSLILQGKQGIGKDFWIDSLVKSFDPYHQKPILTEKRKDIMESLTRVYICHIEEFDQTSVLDPGFIKSIITQNRSMYREAYGHVSSAKPLHHSVVASVNPLDFLRDTTGNRRFVVVPLTGIERNYPIDQSSQIMAQFLEIYRSKSWQVSDETQAQIDLILAHIAPENMDELILEQYGELFLRQLAFPTESRLEKDRVPKPQRADEHRVGVLAGTEIVRQIAKNLDIKVTVVRAALKRAELIARSHGSSFFRFFGKKPAPLHPVSPSDATGHFQPYQ
jgi:hypothetical protein